MPNLELALLSFGKLVGVMDPAGSVRWMWFLDPLDESLKSMADQRAEFGLLLRALLDRPAGTSPDYDAALKLVWEAINPVAPLGVGFVWNSDVSDPLQLGIAAKGSVQVANQPLSLSLLARLLKVDGSNANVTSELGQIRFGGSFPVPGFLTSAALNGEYNNSLTLALDVTDPLAARKLEFPTPQPAWDAARLAIFVLRAWFRTQAAQPGFLKRIDRHLFPMLGDPPNGGIASFPLLADAMKTVPSFDAWADSIFTTDNNAAGALTFLWHARALITDNEDPQIFSGSYHFPLITGTTVPGGPIPSNFPVQGSYANAAGAGVWLGLITLPEANPTGFDLVVDIRNGQPGSFQRIVLAHVDNSGTLMRPNLPSGAAWTAFKNYISAFPSPFTVGAGQIKHAPAGNDLLVSVLSGNGAPPFNGAFSIDFVLRANGPVAYKLTTPLATIELPPNAAANDPETLFVSIVQWVLTSVATDPNSPEGKIIAALINVVNAAIAGGTVSPSLLLDAVATAAGNGTLVQAGPLTIGLDGGDLETAVAIGPVTPEALAGQNVDFSIGKIVASASLSLTPPVTNPISKIGLSIFDLRLGTGSGTAGSGLIASLIPDLREAPGFLLAAEWNVATGKVKVTGGGKIPIQRTIGPLDLVALLVDVRENSLSVAIDLSFKLSVITVTVFELGIQFPFSSGTPKVFLHGLGLSFNASGIKLAGMFAEVPKNPPPNDYVGGAVVSVVNMFELSAIGGYTEVEGQASLFIFASLVAPLGGPPWFFITGVAGGFGFNRTLPPPGLLSEHPFMRVMRGEISMGGPTSQALTALSKEFVAKKDSHWIAAGIQFISFGFIQGKVVIAVRFGNKFSLNILGLAAFGIKPIAYFELAIEITVDEEKFWLKAGLSSNSYIIHPDIFSLRGDFALAIWYAAPNAGDFVLSIGGYHPYFPVPAHYPELNRVGVKALLYNFIRLSVEVFFACTPQAIMAGASISLSAEFAGIGAGLDVYIDVFIRWDPFFMQARMGIVLWFQFMGRHEISVELSIHTPPFGGTATIDLALVSFDVDFGSKIDKPPSPALYEFMTRQLGAPATKDGSGAVVNVFNTDKEAGLFRIDFTYGRTTKPQSDSAKQEGIAAPIPVSAEFGFTVRTRLPIKETGATSPPPLTIEGETDMPLTEMMDLPTSITVAGLNIGMAGRERLTDFFPAANFGDELSDAQADDLGARHSVGKTKTSDAVIALTEGWILDYKAILHPASPPPLVQLLEEDSLALEEYPLPLKWSNPGNQTWKTTKGRTKFKAVSLAVKINPRVPHTSRQKSSLAVIQKRVYAPLDVFMWTGDLQRFEVSARLKGLTVAAPPAGSALINIPDSPIRRAELFGVNLRIVPPHANISLKKGRLETHSKARNLTQRTLTARGGATGAFQTSAKLLPGKAVAFQLSAGRISTTKLTFAGQQTVRAIFLGGGGDLIADMYVAGVKTISAPARSRRVVLIGEGMHPPIAAIAGVAASVPSVQENIGVEHDTTLLALGRRSFAAHGCIIEAKTPLTFSAQVFDSVPGFQLLRSATNFRLHFPMMMKSASLILTVAPMGANPGSALDQIRWVSIDAKLSDLNTVIRPEGTAFVMTVDSAKAWWMDLDLGSKWRLAGAVASPRNFRDTVNGLRRNSRWDLVDDRLEKTAEVGATNIAVAIAQGVPVRIARDGGSDGLDTGL